jgi:protein O-mannosyl-transferase
MPCMAPVAKIKAYLPLLALAIVSFAIYWPALGHDFLINWDDSQYLLENPVIRGLTLDHLRSAFTTSFLGNYAPLHIISYMLDYEIWGLRASGFIFTNILLHAANGLLYYLLLRRLAGEKVWVFLAALIFLLHPVQVESVVWISQRKNLLAMCLFLIGLYSYTAYTGKDERHGTWWYLLSLASFTLALLAKSVAVILPLVLVLFDLCYREKQDIKRVLSDKVPFAVIATVFAVVAIKSHSAQVQGGEAAYYGGSPYATFLTMLPVLARYLGMVFWPARLSAFYDPPVKTGVDSEVAWAALLCVVLILLGAFLYRRRRDIFFWYALFFVGLIPVSQIVPIVTLMNDRYLYFPMLGAAACLGIMLFRDVVWRDALKSRWFIPAALCSLILVVACSGATLSRIGVWRNSATLWRDAVQKAPNAAIPHDSFGEGLLQQGEIAEAVRQFKVALSLEPDPAAAELSVNTRATIANTRNNLGTTYGMQGMTDAAIEQFTVAIRLNPAFAKAYFNLGNALMHKELIEEALRCFETAVRLNPGNPAFNANLRLTREIMSTR